MRRSRATAVWGRNSTREHLNTCWRCSGFSKRAKSSAAFKVQHAARRHGWGSFVCWERKNKSGLIRIHIHTKCACELFSLERFHPAKTKNRHKNWTLSQVKMEAQQSPHRFHNLFMSTKPLTNFPPLMFSCRFMKISCQKKVWVTREIWTWKRCQSCVRFLWVWPLVYCVLRWIASLHSLLPVVISDPNSNLWFT